MKVNVCDIPDGHVSGTHEDLEEHTKLQAPHQVKLLKYNDAQLTDILLNKCIFPRQGMHVA